MADTFPGQDDIVKSLLEGEIKRELEKYKQSGGKIEILYRKKVIKRFTIIGLVCLILLLPLFWITIPVYILKVRNLDDVDVIYRAAKEMPDCTIEQIVAREVVVR